MWKIAKSLICEPIYLNNFEALISIYYVCQGNGSYSSVVLVYFCAYKEMIELSRILYFRFRDHP